jgi:hypothetical protein
LPPLPEGTNPCGCRGFWSSGGGIRTRDLRVMWYLEAIFQLYPVRCNPADQAGG